MMRIVKLGLIACLLLGVGLTSVQAAQGGEAQPMNAVDGILAAFDRYPLVAIGETHGLKELGDFYQALVRAPGFAEKADAIVVEFGNAFYQDVIDRYVAGEDVPHEQLSHVWRDVVGAGFGALDAPMYEGFFTAVREVNQTLPEAQRLRVFLGDPPLDWSTVSSAADIDSAMQQRDSHFASVVENQVLKPGLKALIIIGGAHLSRGPVPMMITSQQSGPGSAPSKPSDLPQMMLQILDKDYPGQTFVVQVHTGYLDSQCNTDVESKLVAWPTPGLALVKGTWLESVQCLPYPQDIIMPMGGELTTQGGPPGQSMNQAGGGAVPGGQVIQPGQLPFPAITADAYLYLGARDSLTMSVPDPAIYDDAAYFAELNRRSQILRGQPLDKAQLTNRPARLIDAFPLP